ncbi:hypothetical protein LPJ70_000891 [Coemansia sp. RSA 2708]|nr:hypothetical protein LPJ70_000891 [Coemansia sp. RSA 2708]
MSSSSDDAAAANDGKKGPSMTMIIGIIAGVIAVGLISWAALYYFTKKKKQKQQQQQAGVLPDNNYQYDYDNMYRESEYGGYYDKTADNSYNYKEQASMYGGGNDGGHRPYSGWG